MATITINGMTLEYEIKTDDGTGKKFAVIIGAKGKPKGSLEIPAEIKKIPVTSIGNRGDRAFANSDLTSVTIPDGVTTIGEGAFEDCYCLTSVTIPDSLTRIGHRAFWGCRKLFDTETIPGVKLVDGWVVGNELLYDDFRRHLNLKGVRGLGDDAFLGGYRLASVTIPNSVTSIGRWVFQSGKGIKSVTIDCASIGEQAFAHCKELKNVTIGKDVTCIGKCAFVGCPKLESVTIHNGVTSIGEGAFSGTGLKSVTIPDSVTSIEAGAFYGSGGLTSVTIPDSVTSIGNSALSGTGLASVTIPDSVTSVGPSVFKGCKRLMSASLPKSLKGNLDEEDVFEDCPENLKITYRDNTAAATAPKSKGGKEKSASAKKPAVKKAGKKTAKKK